MTLPITQRPFDRRTVLKGAAAAGALQVASPFIIAARGETPMRIGMVDPLTGVYAAVAQNEVIGAKLAVEQINAKGGILGRPIELLVEDSANDVGTGVQKARKLIERDQVIVPHRRREFRHRPGHRPGHATRRKCCTSSPAATPTRITGSDCKWNVYRVCNTTSMEANSVSDLLFNKYGKKWHFITPDYAFGHTLQKACGRRPAEARRHDDRQRAHPARNDRLLRLSHQGARRQSRRPAGAAAGLGHGELPQADRAVRHRTSRSTWPDCSRSSNRSKRCRPRRASASGCSSGTGSSRACRRRRSSSPTSAR